MVATQSQTLVREIAATARDRLSAGTEPRTEAFALLRRALAARCVDPADPYVGHFFWDEERPVVEDLNATHFTLLSLIPILADHASVLPGDLRRELRDAIAQGLQATEHTDVSPDYTNAAVMHVFGALIGGQILNDPRHIESGRRKLKALAELAAHDGGAHEYNSPTYTPLAILVLEATARYARERGDEVLARLVAARYALMMAVHLDRDQRWWAGPFGRAYTPDFDPAQPLHFARGLFISRHETLPSWIQDIAGASPPSQTVLEVGSRKRDNRLTTFASRDVSLGVATRQGLGEQGSSVLARFALNGAGAGTLLTRLMADDMFRAATHLKIVSGEKTRPYSLPELGRMFAVSDGPRALFVYSPNPIVEMSDLSDVRAGLRWMVPAGPTRVLVDGQAVGDFPHTLLSGQLVALEAGRARFAVVPLAHARLGAKARVELRRIDDDLLLDTILYDGPRKGFWDLLSPHDAGRHLDWSPLYRGAPHAPFFLEVASIDDDATLAAFATRVASGVLAARCDPERGAHEVSERHWSAFYERQGARLSLTVDLMHWRLVERTPDVLDDTCLLDAAQARASRDGTVMVGDSRLEAPGASVWLAAARERGVFVAGVYRTQRVGPAKLTLPVGGVEFDGVGSSLIVWRDGQVAIHATDLSSSPRLRGASMAQ